MTSDICRRSFMASGLVVLGLAGLTRPAFALTEARARALVDQVVSDINEVIASGRPIARMVSDFERIFTRYGDVPIIARSTLGADANRASQAQMRAFTEAFRGYVARKYGKRFTEFVGGRIEVKGVREVKSWHEVKSMAYLRGQSPFEVSFLVSDRSGKDLFFDMIIEGISLRLSERTEIGAMLDRRNGNIDALIEDLKRAG
ncbi:MlaC/ttg2D family ABC transporter substrate-binding protein [Roseovarius autotrophicus]|uniref:MlaC/ttg2D family ABC transporter substrate-binding protein n=1 Tax=Roseovarius autotrophicus TaxID=2824121 RepID=UPI001B3852A8|nr:ABC transporter substrate-binding protein [Roseovarius autotrophicus]